MEEIASPPSAQHHSWREDIKRALRCPLGLVGNLLVSVLEVRIPTAVRKIDDHKRHAIADHLEPGDIILTTDPAYLIWETLEYAVAGSHFTHVLIHEGDGSVIEATIEGNKTGVMRSALSDRLVGAIRVAVVRPCYQPDDVDQVLEYCRAQIGKPYDSIFDFEVAHEDSFYCSSLIYQALQRLPQPIHIDTVHRLHRTLVLPDHFLHLEGATIIYADKFSLVSNAAGATPTVIGAAAGAAVLHLVAPHLCLVGGFYLAVATGNKIQTGRFGLKGG